MLNEEAKFLLIQKPKRAVSSRKPLRCESNVRQPLKEMGKTEKKGKKKPYLTTCQYERQQLFPWLRARNGNKVMATMNVHNRRSHADADA